MSVKGINWPTFLLTLFISVFSGIVSYSNAITEIKAQIAVTQNEEGNLKETISELKDSIKDQKKELDEIKNLILTKRQLDDIKSLIIGGRIARR